MSDSFTLNDNMDILTLIGTGNTSGGGNKLANFITGNSGNNSLRGFDGNDTLNGGDGFDTLDGGAGKDVMIGGKNSDVYYIDTLTDKIVEKDGEGVYDTVRTTLAAYTLGANLEDLIFELGKVSAIGNGNALNNLISGGGGNDTLNGLAGSDQLYGNDGNDVLKGGAGHDGLYGGKGDDNLNGGDGSDYLSGDGGSDIMTGGAGDDYYNVTDDDDTVFEVANGGTDWIYASVSLTLAANVENAYLDEVDLTVKGNDLNNYIEGSYGADTIAGGGGADTLLGDEDDDSLSGGAGNDAIEGGFGADTLDGGAGNDLFLYRIEDPTNPSELDFLGGDLITGFEVGKDKIDLYDLFSDFDIDAEDAIGDGYLRFQVSGGDTLLQFDKDGGGDGFVTLATLQNVTNLSLTDIIITQGAAAD
jgi:Ca2+-binding RTX toxin-like protein